MPKVLRRKPMKLMYFLLGLFTTLLVTCNFKPADVAAPVRAGVPPTSELTSYSLPQLYSIDAINEVTASHRAPNFYQ